MRFREATLDDLPAICTLGQLVNQMHHEAWPHVFAGAGDPMLQAGHWQPSIAAPNATTWVCEEEGVVVGFATVLIARDVSPLLQPAAYARVGSICVAEAHRGRGIGKALMAQAEQWAIGRGVTDLRLNVWDFNAPALRLYAALGYAPRSHILGKRIGLPEGG